MDNNGKSMDEILLNEWWKIDEWKVLDEVDWWMNDCWKVHEWKKLHETRWMGQEQYRWLHQFSPKRELDDWWQKDDLKSRGWMMDEWQVKEGGMKEKPCI
jgi:hypothetical protein